jgi:hypothetical protein
VAAYQYLADTEGCNMHAANNLEVVMWTAHAHLGEYLGESDELLLLSTRGGSREWWGRGVLPPDDASKCLVCLLADLKTSSPRFHFPFEPAAHPERFMTVFVERLANLGDIQGRTVARFDIVCDIHYASAGVLRIGAPREDVGPVLCAQQDSVWEVMLKLLSAMYAGI